MQSAPIFTVDLVNIEGGSVQVARLQMAIMRTGLQTSQSDIHSAHHYEVHCETMSEGKNTYAEPLQWICRAPRVAGSLVIQLWPSMDATEIPKERRHK